MKDFGGKVIVITGAGSGIGKALALEFAQRGSQLAPSDIDRARAEATAIEAVSFGATAKAYRLDTSDRAKVIEHAREVRQAFGRINMIINNAGVGSACSVLDTSWEEPTG